VAEREYAEEVCHVLERVNVRWRDDPSVKVVDASWVVDSYREARALPIVDGYLLVF
jgi:hypothetical protein